MKKRILCVLMSLLFVLALVPTSILADSNLESKDVDLVAKYSAQIAANEEIPNQYVNIDSPKNLAIFYRGETLKYKTHGTNCYYNEDGGSRSGWEIDVIYENSKGKTVSKNLALKEITTKETFSFTGSFSTKGFYPKDGVFILASAIFDVLDEEGDELQMCANGYALLTLNKPTKLKATAGKKKVTITYKKAQGGTKYEIYRSTKKSSGYDKIYTTKNAKYIDRKVKKGKRYYYKVRTVRSAGKGTIYSSYTSPVRSKKVK